MSSKPVLLMSPSKVLQRLGTDRLLQVLPPGSVIFTSSELAIASENVAEIRVFDDYTSNDEIPLLGSEAITRHGLDGVVVLAEADVLRAAEIREKHGLTGQTQKEALVFRDKPLMKEYASRVGIPVAPHKVVSTGIQLENAVRELGFPCVVKPPHGRGSSGVEILKGELDLQEFLRKGYFSDHGDTVRLVVESFLRGNQYRVDGICKAGKVEFGAVAQYVGSHLDYLAGGYLGSIVLPEDDPITREIGSLARKVLEEALPPYTGGFHLEAFLTPDGAVFSEVGARLGGGSIPEEIQLSYGVNITEECIRVQCEDSYIASNPQQKKIAGQLHVSPRDGTLLKAPKAFGHHAVITSEIAAAGNEYHAMSHTNNEFARAVFEASSVTDAKDTIRELLDELERLTKWSGKKAGEETSVG